jgi:hypothetical protein
VPDRVAAGRAALLGWGYAVIAVHTDLLKSSEAACVDATLGGGETSGEIVVYRLGSALTDGAKP